MLLTAISVWSQAISSGVFLAFILFRTKWWRTVSLQVVTFMVTCLFMLTLDLALTSTNEGLGPTPWPIWVARLGFTLTMLYGIVRIEVNA